MLGKRYEWFTARQVQRARPMLQVLVTTGTGARMVFEFPPDSPSSWPAPSLAQPRRRPRGRGRPSRRAAPQGVGRPRPTSRRQRVLGTLDPTVVSVVLAIDAGTTGVRTLARRRARRRPAPRVPRVPPVLPAARAGSSTTRSTSSTPRARRSPRSPRPSTGRPDGRGDRDHQPARDDRRVGSHDRRAPPPGHRLAGPPHRGRGATQLARRGPRAADPGPHRAGARPVLLGHEAGVAARRRRRRAPTTGLAFGTVDTWLPWCLTGGPDGGVHATDPSNASPDAALRHRRAGTGPTSSATCSASRRACLPTVQPSSGRFGVTVPDARRGAPRSRSAASPATRPAALFGQACVEPGMTKNTYGTGSFVLMNLGPAHPPPTEGLLTSVAWQLGDDGRLRARRGGVRHRRGDPVAARRARDHRRGRRDRAARGERRRHRAASCSSRRSPGSGHRGGTRTRRGTVLGITRGTTRAAPGPRPSSSRWRGRPATSSTR